MIQCSGNLVGKLSAKGSLAGKLNNAVVKEYPELEDLTVTPSAEEQHFKSEKYIKIDNRPVLFIYKPHEIENYEEMIDYWNRVLEKEGLNKIYIIEYISSKNKKLSSDKSDAVTEFEPLYTTFFDISIFNSTGIPKHKSTTLSITLTLEASSIISHFMQPPVLAQNSRTLNSFPLYSI